MFKKVKCALTNVLNNSSLYEGLRVLLDLTVYFGLKQQYLYTIYVHTVKHYFLQHLYLAVLQAGKTCLGVNVFRFFLLKLF